MRILVPHMKWNPFRGDVLADRSETGLITFQIKVCIKPRRKSQAWLQ
jgi:hypothetical protein